MLDRARYANAVHDLKRIVVAIDPSGTSGNDSGDAVGIVVAGIGLDGLGYVLADETIKASPAVWALPLLLPIGDSGPIASSASAILAVR